MNTTPGAALAPQGNGGTISGEVIQGDHFTAPHSFAAHDYFNLQRYLASRAGVFHSEADIDKAIATITAYEAHVIPRLDQKHVLSDSDMAPKEDVTLRKAPGVTGQTAVVSGPAIDYGRLAAAIIAAQKAAEQDAQGPATSITDAQAPAFGGTV